MPRTSAASSLLKLVSPYSPTVKSTPGEIGELGVLAVTTAILKHYLTVDVHEEAYMALTQGSARLGLARGSARLGLRGVRPAQPDAGFGPLGDTATLWGKSEKTNVFA
jgi:hypothetical protein